ncbi:MAG: hypothetical protein OHK0057_17970 [Thermoflexibacter sp.]
MGELVSKFLGEAKFLQVQIMIPQLNHASFLKEQIDIKQHEEILRNSPVVIDLPRFGTKAKATIGTMYMNMLCNYQKDHPDSKKACSLMGKLHSSIELLWDKVQGKFSMGTKK